MKKILVSLLVLALCAPAMAATINIVDVAPLNDGIVHVIVTAEGAENIVGLGLDIDFTPTTTGAVTAAEINAAANPTFNIYPDAAHDLEVVTQGSYGYGDGTPIANQLGVGEAAVSNSFAISVGALNGEATAGATGNASVVITVTVDGDGELCVKENALRGGIVLTTAEGEDITNGTAGVFCASIIVVGGGTCRDLLTATEQALYDRYVTAGQDPTAWCWQYQCYGDASNAEETIFISGTYRVYQQDLGILIGSWQKTPENGADPRADFNHAEETIFISGTYSVYQQDLGILIGSWQKTTAEMSGNCPTYLP